MRINDNNLMLPTWVHHAALNPGHPSSQVLWSNGRLDAFDLSIAEGHLADQRDVWVQEIP